MKRVTRFAHDVEISIGSLSDAATLLGYGLGQVETAAIHLPAAGLA